MKLNKSNTTKKCENKNKSHVKLSSKAIIQPEKIFNGCDLAWWSRHLLFLFFIHFFLLVRAPEKKLNWYVFASKPCYFRYYRFLVVFFAIRYACITHNTYCSAIECHSGPSSFVNFGDTWWNIFLMHHLSQILVLFWFLWVYNGFFFMNRQSF